MLTRLCGILGLILAFLTGCTSPETVTAGRTHHLVSLVEVRYDDRGTATSPVVIGRLGTEDDKTVSIFSGSTTAVVTEREIAVKLTQVEVHGEQSNGTMYPAWVSSQGFVVGRVGTNPFSWTEEDFSPGEFESDWVVAPGEARVVLNNAPDKLRMINVHEGPPGTQVLSAGLTGDNRSLEFLAAIPNGGWMASAWDAYLDRDVMARLNPDLSFEGPATKVAFNEILGVGVRSDGTTLVVGRHQDHFKLVDLEPNGTSIESQFSFPDSWGSGPAQTLWSGDRFWFVSTDQDLVSLDGSGSLSASVSLGQKYGSRVLPLQDGGFVTAGSFEQDRLYDTPWPSVPEVMHIARFDSTGKLVWNKEWIAQPVRRIVALGSVGTTVVAVFAERSE